KYEGYVLLARLKDAKRELDKLAGELQDKENKNKTTEDMKKHEERVKKIIVPRIHTDEHGEKRRKRMIINTGARWTLLEIDN
ncbi:MAG: hypothetical protein KKC23_06210, partial [Proteobacteria bacterium]|nr:hypothetical protein [Pseudomonadota bacterium]